MKNRSSVTATAVGTATGAFDSTTRTALAVELRTDGSIDLYFPEEGVVFAEDSVKSDRPVSFTLRNGLHGREALGDGL
ncbi:MULTISPECIES: hypothetical protein [Bradyrhizobium]|uniref:hypothetical protein n=1 Tax=Bradyrhizobium TaxID=374 RepID=UPI0024B0720D|nr:hypothetical protein [Bradyrhizobium barranii]WFT96749.1 hypothetical protein QA633_06445 [Bradyrhizobium barranii]